MLLERIGYVLNLELGHDKEVIGLATDSFFRAKMKHIDPCGSILENWIVSFLFRIDTWQSAAGTILRY